jgi:hypothetical protein
MPKKPKAPRPLPLSRDVLNHLNIARIHIENVQGALDAAQHWAYAESHPGARELLDLETLSRFVGNGLERFAAEYVPAEARHG